MVEAPKLFDKIGCNVAFLEQWNKDRNPWMGVARKSIRASAMPGFAKGRRGAQLGEPTSCLKTRGGQQG
jgi:hypothetical protein